MQTLSCFSLTPYWKSVFQNAMGCAIGSILAIIISFWIYHQTIRKQQQDRLIADEQDDSDILLYFTESVKGVLAAIRQQSDYIKTFIKTVQDDPLEWPLLTFVPVFDFKRVSENTSMDKVLIAYQHRFGNGLEGVKEFGSIIASIDYLHTEMNWLPDQIHKGQKFDYERKIEMKQIFANAYSLLGQYMLSSEASKYPATTKGVEAIMTKFSAAHANDDLTFYYDKFFVPMNDFFVATLNSGIMLPIFVQLAQLTRDGKQLFGTIKSENIDNAEKLNANLENIDSEIKELIKSTKTLLG